MRSRLMSSFFILLLMVVAAIACAKGPRLRVDDSLLATLPPGSTQELISARSERDKAKDSENVAQLAIIDAQNQLRLVRAELDVARSEHDQAKTQVDISRRSGDPGAIQSSEDRLALTAARVEERRRKLTLHQRKLELAQAQYDAAVIRTYHHDALVEAAKARAVQGQPKAEGVSVTRFELQASEWLTKLAKAEQEAATVAIEVEEAKSSWKEALARADALAGSPARTSDH